MDWRVGRRLKGEPPIRRRHVLVATLLGGLATTILSKVPLINLIDILFCADLWIGPLLAVWLYRRLAGTLSLRQGAIVGTVAGAWAAIPSFVLALLSFSEAPGLLQSYPANLPVEARFAVTFHVLGMFLYVGLNVMFGLVGGIAGGAIFKTKPTVLPTGS